MDHQLCDVLVSRNLVQSVTQSEHQAGNLLDVIVLEDTALIYGIEVHDPICYGCRGRRHVTAGQARG